MEIVFFLTCSSKSLNFLKVSLLIKSQGEIEKRIQD